MGLLDDIKASGAAYRLTEEALFGEVHREITAGVMRDGLWAKALSQCDMNNDRAKALYIKLRVQSLKDEAEVIMKAARDSGAAQRQVQQQARLQQQKGNEQAAIESAQKHAAEKARLAAKEAREKQLETTTERYAPVYDQSLFLRALRNILLYAGGLCGFLTIVLGLQGIFGNNQAGAQAFLFFIVCVVGLWGSSKLTPPHAIVTCPHCHRKSRVPSNMHMRFLCNTCKREAEIQT